MLKRILAATAVSLLMVLGLGASPAFAATSFFYAVGSQGFTTTLPTGMGANFGVFTPTVNTGTDGAGAHSLAELDAEKTVGGKKQRVELGWNVDPGLYGDSLVHLFAGIWVNDVFQGYNTGVTYLAGHAYTLGQTLTSGTPQKFVVEYQSVAPAGWFIGAGPTSGATYFAYFPATKWTTASPSVTTFTNIDFGQLFGEVASATSASPCTDMGNGSLPAAGPPVVGATIGSAQFTGIASGSINLFVHTSPSTGLTGKYEALALGTAGNIRTFAYGGPGFC